MSSTRTPPLVEMTGVRKRYGAVSACNGAELRVASGQVAALVGANGAGKSTLVGILCGLVRPDEGRILIDGRQVDIPTARSARRLGIGLVAQRPLVAGQLTGLENCALSLGGTAGSRLRRRLADLGDRFGFSLPLDFPVDELSPAQRQQLDILRLLAFDARVMVFDEPTSTLSPPETKSLLRFLRKLAEAGKAVVFVSHKLSEVKMVADTVRVMASGRVVAVRRAGEVSEDELARLISSGELPRTQPVEKAARGGDRLVVDNLVTAAEPGRMRLKHISFTVGEGEIFAVVGVAGNGQRELAECLVGLAGFRSGRMFFDGQRLRSVGRRYPWVGYVPEDFDTDGLVGELSVAENLALGVGDVARRVLRPGRLERAADEVIRDFRIAGSAATPVRALSGGNRMRVLLAREFRREAPLMVISSPAAGLDVSAAHELADYIRRARARGAAVVLISYDLDEVFSLADRIGVLWRGRIVRVWPIGDVSPQDVTRGMITGEA